MNLIYPSMRMRMFLMSAITSLVGFPLSTEPSSVQSSAQSLAQASVQSSVTVNVSGLRSQTGNLMVCLWSAEDEGFPICSDAASFAHVTVAPTASTVTTTFQDIPSGEYAISAFHDENLNGKVDRDFIGRPKEGIAFSNMSLEQRRERPSFERSKFTLNEPETIPLSLTYFR